MNFDGAEQQVKALLAIFPSIMSCIYCIIIASISIYWLPESYLLELNQALIFTGFCLGLAYFVRHWKRLQQLFVVFALLFACLGYSHYSALDLLQKSQFDPYKIQTSFRIVQIQHQQDYQAYIVETISKQSSQNQRIYLSWRAEQKPKLGEIWQAELNVRPISSRLNQGGFDRQKWYLAQGITAWASTKSAVKIEQDFSWREAKFDQALQQTQNLSQQGLLLALGFGERAWLPSDNWKIYQQTNTAHLIAISGLHIGLVMALGFYFARLIQFALITRWISPVFPLLVGLAFALLYAQLAGFAIPTFRAITALVMLCYFRLSRSYNSPWQLYFRTIALLLICDPLMILANSFWLSVLAVACLILWNQLFPLSAFQWQGKSVKPKVRWVFSLFHLQIGLFLFFTPIQIWLFGGFSYYALLTNMVMLPIFSFILVPLVLFAVFSNGSLASWQIANMVADYCQTFLTLFQQGWLFVSQQQLVLIILLLSVFMLIANFFIYRSQFNISAKINKPRGFSIKFPIYRSAKFYYLIQSSLIGLILLSLIHIRLDYLKRDNWRIESLDVGQGLAVLLVKNQHGILYDAGASWGSGSMAEIEILPYLRREGIELDYLILSHDDNDHSGGAKSIIKAFPQAMLISPSLKNYGETHRTFCQQGKSWQWFGLKIEALSPRNIVERAKNQHSCVLLVQDSFHSLLLMGDADKNVEQQILSKLPKVDVLQVGHHGSKTSTSLSFTQHIQPKIALISSGRWNPWHFPHSSVLNHLEASQSAVYNSAIFGQVSIQFEGQSITLQTARNAFSPWYQQIMQDKK